MKEENKRLKIVTGETCFGTHSKFNVKCERRSCSQWITSESDLNCVLIGAKKGPRTLHDIGNIYGLSRMRICQIEKSINTKIEEKINQLASGFGSDD